MTKSEYAAFVDSFQAFMEREGLENLSTVCAEDGDSPEPSFSWSPCHCCGRPLGGNRYECSGYNRAEKAIQDGYSVCQDCVYFAEYGRLDDETMASVERS